MTKAQRGEKMIEIKLRFWTNKIAQKDGDIVPKHAWSSGKVSIKRNDAHGIEPMRSHHFHSLLEINSAIEAVLIDHDIKLHASPLTKKYMVE